MEQFALNSFWEICIDLNSVINKKEADVTEVIET